jgi:hypothetical protein
MDARDYAGLAKKMIPLITEGDLIIVHRKDWATTPIFYYLDSKKYQLVANDFNNTISSHPTSRVWVVLFGLQQFTAKMREALDSFDLIDQVESLRARGMLYARKSPFIEQN